MATGERFGTIFDGGTTLGLGPAELLGRFAERRDEAAFSALVAHHGPMVLATCRRILPNGADADDAFQATFLVLAKKAGAISDPDRLAPWLHGVARRVSVRARSVAARRRAIESEGPGDLAVAPASDDAHDLRAVLDEELSRLPEKYRAPLVLCYLEGLTHDEAAGQLAWPVGTVRSRLAGGRDRLRSRLARRGYASGALAVLSPATLPTAAVSRFLQAATVRLVFTPTAGQVATSAAALLAQGALTSMFYAKIQTIAAFAATMTIATVGVVAAQPRGNAEVKPVANVAPPAVPPAILDQSTPPVDLAKELDAAKDRIKALEAELAALKANNPPAPPLAPADPTNPPPPPAPPGGVASGRRQLAKLPTLEELKAKNPPTPAAPEPPATPRPPTNYTTTERISDDPFRAPATSTTTTYTRSAEAPVTPSQTPTPPLDTASGLASRGRVGGPGFMGGRGGGMASTSTVNSGQANKPAVPVTLPLPSGNVLIIPIEQDRATVLNTRSGVKATFRPAGQVTSIAPVCTAGVVGLALAGPKVPQVAAYSQSNNEWSVQDLREPISDGWANPIVGGDSVEYRLGRYLYIFSGRAGRWGVLELQQPIKQGGSMPGELSNGACKMITEGDTLHAYNYETGEWTHTSTKDDK